MLSLFGNINLRDTEKSKHLLIISRQVMRLFQLGFQHPYLTDWRCVSLCLFAGALQHRADGLAAKSAVAIRPGKIDRSPTGTAVSARMAVLHTRGMLQKGPKLNSDVDHRVPVRRTYRGCADALRQNSNYSRNF